MKKPLPSQSLPPGPARWAALLTADPAVWVTRLVAAALEGVIFGFLRWRDRRKHEQNEEDAKALPDTRELERQAADLRALELERGERELERRTLELERGERELERRELELDSPDEPTHPTHGKRRHYRK